MTDDEIIALRRGGMAYRDIAAICDRSHTAVARLCKRAISWREQQAITQQTRQTKAKFAERRNAPPRHEDLNHLMATVLGRRWV